MNDSFGDARLEELKLLSEMEYQGELEVTPSAGPWRDLIIYLVQERLVNDPNTSAGPIGLRKLGGLPGESELERSLHAGFVTDLCRVIEGCTIKLKLSHRGRVRLYELKNSLRSGREREPFGILWDVRHWELDVQIAILEAREDSPLAIAYLDLNGLKTINDTRGHDAGDLALRAYFQAVSSVLPDRAQAYRLSGGADEVLVLLPNCGEQLAVRIVQLACNKLMNERLWPTDPNGLLSIAAGLVINADPKETAARLRSAADTEQKKAKQRSKQTTPRPSVIAIAGNDNLNIIKHQPFIFPVKIVGSYFESVPNDKGISFTVTNLGREQLSPYKISFFHPKLGSNFLFPSEKSGPLLPDQERHHSCPVIRNGIIPQWFPKLSHDIHGTPLDATDDADFEFQLVLEDSSKVLYRNKRIGKGLVALLRRAMQNGTEIGGTGDDWRELNNNLPDK